jgi:hypothetical protein
LPATTVMTPDETFTTRLLSLSATYKVVLAIGCYSGNPSQKRD